MWKLRSLPPVLTPCSRPHPLSSSSSSSSSSNNEEVEGSESGGGGGRCARLSGTTGSNCRFQMENK